MDVSMLAPFTNVECPDCGEHKRVKCKLGNYELKRRQGVGGMSLVFGALDMTLGREVAIKILNEAYSMDEKRITQFEQEAQITAAISHPHVVRVYTVGQAYGRFYIAMEMVAGDSMEKRMSKRGALDEADIVTLATQVTEGLQAAHKAGLIHRDIKPGNILFDTNDSAKIVDFGLALVTQGGVAKAEEIWATPYYVPPETLDGLDEDFRSDIYALGASLYHAISGKPPFDQETKSTSELKTIKMTLPSLKKAAPWVSDEVCGVIDRAMAFDPDGRFQSYEDMLLALKHVYSTGDGYGARSISPRAKRRAVSGGLPMGYVAGGVALLLIGGGVLYSKFSKGADDSVPTQPYVSSDVQPTGVVSDAKQQLIAAEVRSSRNLMKQRNYRAASKRLLNIVRDDGVPSETVYWAGLQSSIVSMLDGRSRDARNALGEVTRRQERNGGAKSVTDIKLSEAIKILSDFRPVRESDLSEVKDDLDMMILFAAALKNWEQGVWGDADALFRKFSKTSAGGDSEEVIFYRELVNDYLHDMKILSPFRNKFVPLTIEEAEMRKGKIENAAKSLKTRGRAGYNAVSMQEQISIQIRALESKLAKGFKIKPPRKVSQFELVELIINKLVNDVNFAKCAEVLKEFEPENEDQEEWRNQMLYMTESAAGFLGGVHVDLADKSGNFSIKSRDGKVEYGRVEGANEDGLRVLDDGGKKLLRWKEISPDSMLELHKQVVKSEASEFQRNLRLEQAICYAWLMGLRDKAGTAAAKLAVHNEIFAERWKVIVRVLN